MGFMINRPENRCKGMHAQLTLEEAERLCNTSELAQQHAKTFNETGITAGNDSSNVAVVQNKIKKNVAHKKSTEDAMYS